MKVTADVSNAALIAVLDEFEDPQGRVMHGSLYTHIAVLIDIMRTYVKTRRGDEFYVGPHSVYKEPMRREAVRVLETVRGYASDRSESILLTAKHMMSKMWAYNIPSDAASSEDSAYNVPSDAATLLQTIGAPDATYTTEDSVVAAVRAAFAAAKAEQEYRSELHVSVGAAWVAMGDAAEAHRSGNTALVHTQTVFARKLLQRVVDDRDD